jgi:hypothetical protein
MTDTNPEADSRVGPDDPADYNPESIDYEAQDNDGDYASDDAPNDKAYDPGYVDTTSQATGQTPQSPTASRSQVAAHSSTASRSPTAVRQYDPLENAPPTQTTNNGTFKSPVGDVNDNHASSPQPQSVTDAPKESVLPKSVDLQALLAGLVPARSKVSNSPVQAHEKPGPPPPIPQTFSQVGISPPPAMNLPPDIMYQLQNLTSPPPQSSFQPPPQQSALPQQSGPVDIQPEDLVLTPQEEHLYEKFLQNEREVVQNARWEEFPPGSRMFIGNLPSDRIGKKDIFRLFYPYGRLAQISIKQAYGFVQFYEKADCDTAIRSQQGMILTGRKVRTFPT